MPSNVVVDDEELTEFEEGGGLQKRTLEERVRLMEHFQSFYDEECKDEMSALLALTLFHRTSSFLLLFKKLMKL